MLDITYKEGAKEGKMKRDLWNAVHNCIKCNALMKKKALVVEGVNVRGWECIKCKDIVLHP